MALPRLRQAGNNGSDDKPQHPNHMIYSKMETLIHGMMCEEEGLTVKTVKSFLSRIPNVFTGVDLVQWILAHGNISDINEALHTAHLLACHGYLFPIDDHQLTVKNDSTFYRLQTPYFWPCNCWEPENTDYAVYLCKRTMQTKAHLELEDYEAENLAKLQRMYSRKWEFVFMQAEAQYKVDKKRDRMERQILDSQERAFWDVHRPMPGCVNTTEVDFRKLSRSNRCCPSGTSTTVDGTTVAQQHHQRPGLRRCTLVKDILRQEVMQLEERLARNALKTSKVIESLVGFYTQRCVFDPFLCPMEPANPWVSDLVDLWSRDKITGELSARRMKQWGLSFDNLLHDSKGQETLQLFLDKEYSGENLRFWMHVQKLRWCSNRMVPIHVTEIYNEYLSAQATSPVNVDSKVMDTTEENLKNSNRWSFDEAADHIYMLMKNDKYKRFLRSEFYKENRGSSTSKPNPSRPRMPVFSSSKKENTPSSS